MQTPDIRYGAQKCGGARKPHKSYLDLVKAFIGGGLSMTVCQDKAGIAESGRVAKDWIAKNAANTGVDAPKVSEGSIIIHAK